MKTILRLIESGSDTELRTFIAHCERQLNHADPDVRRMARKALIQAREEQVAREFLQGLPRDSDRGE